LEGARGDIKSVEEDSEDWVVGLGEGGVDAGVCDCAVARRKGLQVVNLEEANLDLLVGAGPEVDLDLRPERCAEVEGEGGLRGGDGSGIDGKIVGSQVVDREVLKS